MTELASFGLVKRLSSPPPPGLHSSKGELCCDFDIFFLVNLWGAPPDLVALQNARNDGHMLGWKHAALRFDHKLSADHSVFAVQAEHEGTKDENEFNNEDGDIDPEHRRVGDLPNHN